MIPQHPKFVELKTKLVNASSEDPEYRAEQLLHRDQLSPNVGWQSERYCQYPQDLDFVFLDQAPCLREIRLLAHEEKIATRIEVFVGQSTKVAECTRNTIQLKRLGSCSLEGPRQDRENQQRELKSLSMKVNCKFLRVRLHKCFVSRLNIYNQVGIVGIMFFGLANYNEGRLLKSPSNLHAEVLNQANDPHPYVKSHVHQIRAAKRQAVTAEDFERAHNLKEAEGYFLQVGCVLDDMESRKNEMILKEEYLEAQTIKKQIEELKSRIVVHVASTMDSLALDSCANNARQCYRRPSVDERAAIEAASKLLKPFPRGENLKELQVPESDRPTSPYSNQKYGPIPLGSPKENVDSGMTLEIQEDSAELVLGVPGTQLLPNPVPITAKSGVQEDIKELFGPVLLNCALSTDHWGLRHIALVKLTMILQGGEFDECKECLVRRLEGETQDESTNWTKCLKVCVSVLHLVREGVNDVTVNVVKAASTLFWAFLSWIKPLAGHLGQCKQVPLGSPTNRRDFRHLKPLPVIRCAIASVLQGLEQRIIDWNFRIVQEVVDQLVRLSEHQVVGAEFVASVLLRPLPLVHLERQQYLGKRHLFTRLHLLSQLLRRSEEKQSQVGEHAPPWHVLELDALEMIANYLVSLNKELWGHPSGVVRNEVKRLVLLCGEALNRSNSESSLEPFLCSIQNKVLLEYFVQEFAKLGIEFELDGKEDFTENSKLREFGTSSPRPNAAKQIHQPRHDSDNQRVTEEVATRNGRNGPVHLKTKNYGNRNGIETNGSLDGVNSKKEESHPNSKKEERQSNSNKEESHPNSKEEDQTNSNKEDEKRRPIKMKEDQIRKETVA